MAKKTKKPSGAEPAKPKKPTSKKSSPLTQASELLKQALKGDDWKADLDPKNLRQPLPHLSSGSLVIDHLIGGKANANGVSPCPGFPRGRILNLYGHEGSGKTTIALQSSAETIRAGGTVCYIDWEHEIVPGYAHALGVPIGDESKFMLCQPDTLDDGVAILWTMASAGVDLIVLDSVGAGVPKAFFEKSIKETADQGRVGMNAAVWSQFLPKLKARINKTKSTVIGISQIRDAINTMGYGDKITVQGGKAWKFYSAVRLRLQKVGTEKASDYSSLVNKAQDRVVGALIKAKLDKCKVSSQQGNEENFYIRWGEGIDNTRSLIEIAVAHKIIAKNGAHFRWTAPDGTEQARQGMDKLRQMFIDNALWAKLLEKQVKPHMAMSGESSDDDEEDDPEMYDQDAFTIDAEIGEILGSITDGGEGEG
jgi:recombination protein RecA